LDPESVYQLKKTFVAAARQEVPKILAMATMAPKDSKKAATILTELYTIVAETDFGDKLEMERLQQILATSK
jgi:hypothetical protein